jgi:ABC-2 type transport system permease protein
MTHDTSLQDDFQPLPPAPMAATRPLYWSVRREIWENRSIYLAPLIVAVVVLFASSISTLFLPKRIRTLDPARRPAAVMKHIRMAPAPIMMASFIVGIFFCLDAMYGERRDRSILFWKSLPVPDRTTVLSKAAVPMVVLPLIALALSVVTQAILLIWSSMVLVGNGMSPVFFWGDVHFFEGVLVMFYGLAVHTLWFAPIYAWLLLLSAWAKRSPVLWALLPVLAIAAMERMASGRWAFMNLLKYRVTGAMSRAFLITGTSSNGGSIDRVWQLTPGKFLSTPGLWAGLIFAALCVMAAVRLRRSREPL